MREIITQLQPGREGGRQGSGEREGRRDGGQRGRGCKGDGGGGDRGGWRDWGEGQGMSWKDMEGLPLSTAIFPGSGRLDGGDLGTIGDSWLWGSRKRGAHAAHCCSTLQWPGTPLTTVRPLTPLAPYTGLPPNFTPARG